MISPWNEAAVEYNNVFYIVDRNEGVITIDRGTFETRFIKRTFSSLRLKDPAKFVHFLNRQLTKPYDRWGTIPWLRRTPWIQETRWTSSELIAAALEIDGYSMPVDRRRCTPICLWYHLPKVVVS